MFTRRTSERPRDSETAGQGETPDPYGAFPRLSDEQITTLAMSGHRRPTRRGLLLATAFEYHEPVAARGFTTTTWFPTGAPAVVDALRMFGCEEAATLEASAPNGSFREFSLSSRVVTRLPSCFMAAVWV